MISCVVILLLQNLLHYQKLSQLDLGIKISYDILTDSPQVINDKVLFVVHICLMISIKILTLLMIFWVVLMLLIFTLPKTIPTWPRGQNIVWYFDPPSNNQWQSFICLSYLLEKMYYYIKIMLMTSLVLMMLLFCTTNTWFLKVMNGFISCKLKHQSPPHFILISSLHS